MARQRPRIVARLTRRMPSRVWPIKTITIAALVVIVVTAVSVFLLGKRSLFEETELTLAIIAAALFAFLAVGLYHGVRVRARDLPGTETPGVSAEGIADGVDPISTSFDAAGAADDPLSAVAAFIISVVALVLLSFLLWALLSLGIVLWVFLIAAVSWVFHRALRVVFAKSRACRGRIGASLRYALLYTALYTGWLFALVLIAEYLFERKLRGG